MPLPRAQGPNGSQHRSLGLLSAGRKAPRGKTFWCPVLDVVVILSFMSADKEIKAPWGGRKHVRAGGCTSIKADRRFVQLMGSQIATLRGRIAPRRGAGRPPGLRDRRGTGEAGAQRRTRAGRTRANGVQVPGPPSAPPNLRCEQPMFLQPSEKCCAERCSSKHPDPQAWTRNGKS